MRMDLCDGHWVLFVEFVLYICSECHQFYIVMLVLSVKTPEWN